VGLVGIDVYRAQVREAVRLLEEPDYLRAVCERFARRRDRAASTGAHDEAISWQRRLVWLEELDSYRFVLERPWVDRSWLIVLPGPSEAEKVLVPVARGRVLERRTVPWSGTGWADVVEDAIYSVRLRELQAETVFQPADLTPSLIVTTWLESGAPAGRVFDLERHDARFILERLRPDAKPERDRFVSEEPAPVRSVRSVA
jgi:hypothetical protein